MLTLDHLVVLVPNLQQAVSSYAELGFRVTPGGTHADGLTHNALVVFADGTYLELIAFIDLGDPRDNVWGWRAFLPTGGLIDYCVTSNDLATDVPSLRRRGLQVSEPYESGRQRPDGTELRWRSAQFKQQGRVLPFLIQDITPRSLRVPDGAATQHANRATGISELIITVEELEPAAALVRALVDSEPLPTQIDHELSARIVRYQLGSHTLRLAAPDNARSPLYHKLNRHGAGLFGYILRLGTGDWRLETGGG